MQSADSSELVTNDSEVAGRPPGSTIVAEVASSFTYASYQNAIPVIRSIRLDNDTARSFENCRLELTSSPSFLRPKTWTVDRLIPGDRLQLSDRKVELDAGYLAGLNERVWSTDWWFDSKSCADRLHASLETLLKESRARHSSEQTGEVTTRWEMGQQLEPTGEPEAQTPAPIEEPLPLPTTSEVELVSARVATAPEPSAVAAFSTMVDEPTQNQGEQTRYRVTDLTDFRPDPEQFFEFSYGTTLRGMIEAVVDTESPLRSDVLAQRIARVHGWLRTGGRIRERIDLHLRDLDRTQESSGEFIWKKSGLSDLLPYRQPVNEEARRSIADIPLAELASVVIDNPGLLDMPDPARDMAHLLGVERLAAVSRARLDEAIARARQHIAGSS
ncbi:DUF3320 domain-containing protein [Mesorhizobium sp. M0408]|uniref:DUF3320 domain-containing protein n=1 Tax=unclassified Mesorhizobium TaxID=325217 RepID=UPI003337416A